MNKLLPLLLILITANALAQYKPDTTHIKIVTATAEMILNDMSGTKENKNSKYTQEQIDRALDTSYVFFILNDSVYSADFSVGYSGIVSACRYLENESNLSEKEINNAFSYLSDWWNYDPEYSDNEPDKNKLSQKTLSLLNANNDYSRAVSALITMRKTVFEEKYTETQKNDMFTGAAKKIGIPENKIPEHNPFSDDYNIFGSYVSVVAYEVIMENLKLAKTQENGAKLDATITKQNIHIIYLGKVGIQLSDESIIDKEKAIDAIAYLKKNPLCFHWGDEQEYKKNLEWFEETVEFF